MLAALLLDQLQRQTTPITKEQLTELYKQTYKEAYKEGQMDQTEKCGCDEKD